jgi:hypothetical protein
MRRSPGKQLAEVMLAIATKPEKPAPDQIYRVRTSGGFILRGKAA